MWSRYEAWAGEATAIVFIGSSNAVGLTTNALHVAKERSLPVFSFNLSRQCMESTPSSVIVHHVLGPAEETVPLLLDAVLKADAAAE